MKKYKIIFVLVVAITMTLVAFGQMTEQSENECFEGGLLEGQCSTTDVNLDGDVDQEDIDWMYKCGWFLAQADDNLIGRDAIPLDGCELPEREIPRPEKTKEPTEKVDEEEDECELRFPAVGGLQAVDGCYDPCYDSPVIGDLQSNACT